MAKQHAVLSPSAAARWINCPGSVRLSEQMPPEPSSPFADEGTMAHSVAELKLLREIGEISDKEYGDRFSALISTDQEGYWCGEMDEATDFYLGLVIERLLGAGPDGELMVEQRLDLGAWAKGSFGTADAVVIGNGVLEVIDFKYGKGIRVDAVQNPQLRLYALGTADLFDGAYDFEAVRMTIVQPRLDHVSTDMLTLKGLRDWGKNTVKPAAKEAAGKDARTACGDWCRWCPAKAVCRTRAEAQLELTRMDFKQPDLLTDEEIGDVLAQAEELQRWVADVQAYALQGVLDGKHFDGWKLVEGRSVRKYTDDLKVAQALNAAGWEDAMIYERKLLGLTAMEKLVGKKQLAEVLGDLITKPAGKPVLVPETDKREAISSTEGAKADFGGAQND